MMSIRPTFAAIFIGLLAVGTALAAPPGTVGDRTAIMEGSGAKVLLRKSGTWSMLPTGTQPRTETDTAPAAVAPAATIDETRKAPANEMAAPSPPPRQEDRQLLLLLAAGGGGLFLIVAGLLLYFLVIAPGKKLSLLRKALEIVDSELKERYDEAEDLLNRAITAGLHEQHIREAYFARAFIYASRNNPDGAVADLKRADRDDPAVLYLELWAHVKQEKFQEAFTVFAGKEEKLREFENGPRLMSLVCLHLARQHWKNRAIDDAIGYFERVRDLKVHADKVPASVSDHQSTLGVVALFDNQSEEAERHFNKALERAKVEKTSGLSARVGLLLCRWRKSEHPQLDGEVEDLVKHLGPVPATIAKVKPTGGDETPLTDEQLMARNLLLLHAVSWLHTLHHHPEKSGMSSKDRDELQRRAQPVLKIDAKMPDPKLITGLVDYYFFNDTRKDEAVQALKESGSDLPEVSLLLAKEAKLKTLAEDLLKTYVGLVKDYVGDHEIPMKVRQDLLASLDRFPRFKQVRGELTLAGEDAGGATLNGLQSRALLLRKRIGTIVKPALATGAPQAVESIERLMTEMEKDTATIRKAATELEKKEMDLMLGTGEFLLKEEEPPAVPEAKVARIAPSPVRPLAPIEGGLPRGPNTRT